MDVDLPASPDSAAWWLPPSPLLRRCGQQVRSDVRRLGLWRPGDRVGWACSGGLDSLCGLRLLAWLRRSLGHEITVLHIDHGVQPDRAVGLDLIRTACANLALPLHIAAVVVPTGGGWEGRARTARYAALAALAEQTGCAVVATAHHADDQAETLLMRLARGAGPSALAGIAPQRGDGVVRPLLALQRSQLAALHGQLPYWTDPSNANLDFTRNRTRHCALPALNAVQANAVGGLARSAQAFSLHEQGVDAWISVALAGAVQLTDADLTVPRDRIPPVAGAQALFLRWVAAQLSVPAPTVAAVHAFVELASRPQAGRIAIVGLDVTQTRLLWQFARRVANANGQSRSLQR
ncbi:MAG: tRNA lysidine(34) synthetase TilS [Myxococcales bacterium]|nr:tRNA lysidine(34) synthetase TilS [Myxococcales bacterium]